MTLQWNPTLYQNKHAFVYDHGASLLSLLKPNANERILDLGCGTGQLTASIKMMAGGVTGMDASPEMIKNARITFPEISFTVGDAANFHFDTPFDAIFSNATLHWVLRYKEALQCIYNNLKIGGRLVFEFGGKGNVQTIVRELKTALQLRGYTEQAAISLWYFPSAGEYACALEQAGFYVNFIQQYDRPTVLMNADTGIKDWLSMFAQPFFKDVCKDDLEEIKEEVQRHLKSSLFKKGKWHADYKRIRGIAIKQHHK